MHKRHLGYIAFTLSFVVAMGLSGCVAPVTMTEPTPEEIAARQDSIAKANEFELRKNRSFAHENIKNKNWERAKPQLWKVVALDVKNEHNIWSRLYQVYTELGQTDSSIVVLQMGLEKFPDDPYLATTYGFFLKAQGKYEEALELYQRGLAEDPENLEFLRKEAELFESLDSFDEAIASYEKLLSASPDDQEAKDKLTNLLRQHRDPEEYIAHLEKDVEGEPENVQKRSDLILAYKDMSLSEKILVQADALIALDATMKDAYIWKAEALENLNRLNDAISTWSKLLEQYSDYNQARLSIADNFRLLNQFSKARTWVLKARKEASGKLAQADYILAQIFESCGDKNGSSPLKYDDKLVFVIAYGLYEKVAASDDYNVKSQAQARVANLGPFLPEKGDWFLNKSTTRPGKAEYKWINENWSEVKYIDTFLRRFK